MNARLHLLGLLLLPGVAAAWPVDGFIDVEPGADKLVKFGALDAATVDDPKIADVEVMPESGELLVTGKKPGRALVQLTAQGRHAVWRLRVGGKPQQDANVLEAAKKACPNLATPAEGHLSAPVASEPCRQALLKLLAQDRFTAKDVEVEFEVKALQGQLADLEKALAAAKLDVKVRYEGAGLVLAGKVDEAGHRRTHLELFKKAVGRLALNDQLEVASAPDAGAPTAPGVAP